MARYIDAEPLREKLCEHIEKAKSELWVNALCTFVKVLDLTPTIDAVPRWIPCAERLPEIGEGFCSKDVIVALDDGGITFTCLESTPFGSVCWQIERMNEIEDGKEINVVAWMPLPEPYVAERRSDE